MLNRFSRTQLIYGAETMAGEVINDLASFY